MRINDLGEKLHDLKISKITIATDDKNQCVALADQQVPGKFGITLMQHQCVGKDHQSAVDELLSRASRAITIGGPVVMRPIAPLES